MRLTITDTKGENEAGEIITIAKKLDIECTPDDIRRLIIEKYGADFEFDDSGFFTFDGFNSDNIVVRKCKFSVALKVKPASKGEINQSSIEEKA